LPSCSKTASPWRKKARQGTKFHTVSIFYILRTGSPWRDLPERYGPYTTVYNRFNRWAKAGVWVNIFNALAARSPESMAFIDSSIVRAHQHAAGGKKGARITPSVALVAD
jgi:transposase